MYGLLYILYLMHSPHIKYKAKKMRENGASIDDISTSFNISKSTVSYWCKNIKLKESAIQKIKTKGRKKSVQGLLRYSELKREERLIRT